MAIPIINELGLGLSLLLFSITNCLTNFVVGTFGLFHLKPRPAEIFWLNCVGMVFVLIGSVHEFNDGNISVPFVSRGAMISFVKSKPSELMEQMHKVSIETNSVVSFKRFIG